MSDTLSVKSRFKKAGYEWIVLDNVEVNGEKGVFAIMTSTWNGKEYPFDENCKNNYAKSTLRDKLLAELLPKLGEENLLPHTMDLISDDGDKAYGTLDDKVFILSCDEYRKYRECVPLIPEWSWTCTPWYINPDTGNGGVVRVIDAAGDLYGYVAYYAYGVLPACIFKSSNL